MLTTSDFKRDVKELKEPFSSYRKFLRKSYKVSKDKIDYIIAFLHIQGSPDAMPASLIDVKIPNSSLNIDYDSFDQDERLALTDYIARLIAEAIRLETKPLKGLGSSGSFQPLELGQEILFRNIVSIGEEETSLWIRLSFPAKNNKSVFKEKFIQMIDEELHSIIKYVRKYLVEDTEGLEAHKKVVRNFKLIQSKLREKKLIAFIADGLVLPRRSGNSDLPLEGDNVIKFKTDDSLKVEIDFGNGEKITGMGIPEGITVIVGAGYHGKSTLLNALVKGVYPHISGDGREFVVTREDAVKIKAEDGRAVSGVNISCFVDSLPSGKNTKRFFTSLASGSTSQAASLVEFVTAGVRLFFIDEDDSATNFLMQDPVMRELISVSSLTPLSDRLEVLKKNLNISIIIICGGSSSYIKYADTVVEMVNYMPVNVTEKAKKLVCAYGNCEEVDSKVEYEVIECFRKDCRKILKESFDADFFAVRFNKKVKNRIKVLRGSLRSIEYGNEIVDLSAIETIVESYQTEAIGWILLYLKNNFMKDKEFISFEELKGILNNFRLEEILRKVVINEKNSLLRYLSLPRKEDIIAAVNRFRNLKVRF